MANHEELLAAADAYERASPHPLSPPLTPTLPAAAAPHCLIRSDVPSWRLTTPAALRNAGGTLMEAFSEEPDRLCGELLRLCRQVVQVRPCREAPPLCVIAH